MEYYNIILIIGLLVITILVFRKLFFHSLLIKNNKRIGYEKNIQNETLFNKNMLEDGSETVKSILINISKLYFLTILGFSRENRKELSKIRKEIKELNREIKRRKKNLFLSAGNLDNKEIVSGHYYNQVLDILDEATNCLQYIISPLIDHFENKPKAFPKEYIPDLIQFNEKMSEYFNFSINIIKNNRFENYSDLVKYRIKVDDLIGLLKKNQIQQLKKEDKGTKASLVVLEILMGSKNLISIITNVVEAQKGFFDNNS